jgi:hypothetical protein
MTGAHMIFLGVILLLLADAIAERLGHLEEQ